MEKDVSEGLLTTRLAEMHPHWEKCRDSLSAVMSQLETNLDKVAYVGKQLCSYHSQMDSLEKQVELLQEALHSPSHPLISMQDRCVYICVYVSVYVYVSVSVSVSVKRFL